MSIDLVELGDAYLARCAARVHARYDDTLRNRGQELDAYLAIGHALLDARRALPSDQAFGLWFTEQNFGFRKRWGLLLRQAAEHEPRVRDTVRSQLRTGAKANIDAAVRSVRSDLVREKAERVTVATVTPITGRRPLVEQIENVRQLAAVGLNASEIAAELGVSQSRVSSIAKAGGFPLGKLSRLAKAGRIEKMRVLAKQGATSQQIAAELGVGSEVVRAYSRDHDIPVPADAATRVRRDIDSTRIVSATIDTIDGIGALFDCIDYSALPAGEISGWVDVLTCSIRSLTNLKKQLKEVTQP